MGKLVLFLKDASPVEIPLSKERVTIGRRPDNDVCLPYPAVSGSTRRSSRSSPTRSSRTWAARTARW
ncbi:MAG: FHA domain-containing protein [Burkholderiales bacterium]